MRDFYFLARELAHEVMNAYPAVPEKDWQTISEDLARAVEQVIETHLLAARVSGVQGIA
jgi:hypothetical protein